MYITNSPDLAELAVQAGVDRIFVDLEVLGKVERQGHLSTVISRHTLNDVKAIRERLPSVELLVRSNPYNDDIAEEIENILKYKPQLIMLPMYKTVDAVQKVSDLIDGRAGLVPLLETPEALENIEEVASINGVTEMYMGLNDLHLAMNKKFMFEFVSSKTVENFANIVKSKKKKFGFGGIARIAEGLLPAEHIIREHDRVGSTSVILSRTFHRDVKNLDELTAMIDFKHEIEKIRECENHASSRSIDQKESDHKVICGLINEIVK